jgi:tripartite motif-containing protein 71
MTNLTDVDAASVKLIFLDPSRKVIQEQPLSVALPAGQSITVPVPYTTPLSSALGIYHVDYILLDRQGNIIQPQAETDSGRFVVSNPPNKYTSNKPVLFSVTTSSQEVLFGAPFDYTFHLFNNTDQVRNLTIRSYWGHTGRDHEWKIAVAPNSHTTISGTDVFIDSRWYFETLRSSLYDESMKLIGSYDLSFKGLVPSGIVTAQTEKTFYRRGDTVPIHGLLKNNSPASWQSNVMVIVLDNNNAKILEDTKAVALVPYGTSPFGTDFLLPQDAEPGGYTIRMEARDGSRLVHAAAASFQVIRSQISISPTFPSFLDSGANILVFELTNTGNVDVTSAVLKVNLKDPGGGTVYETHQPFSLPIGQSTTLNLPLNVPPVKFGTYFLTYTQTDETGDGAPVTVSFFNNSSAVFSFDRPFYRVRDTANLGLELKNTGNFVFPDALVTITVPDTGFTDTRNISLSPGQSLHFAPAIPIPETITAGPHDVNVTVAFPSEDSLIHSGVLTVPESALVVFYEGSTNLNAGDTVNLKIENTGGKDTAYTTEKLLIRDSTGAEIYGGGAEGTIAAGEQKAFADIQVPPQAGKGMIFWDLAVKDGQNGKIANFFKTFEITRVTSSLQSRTDRDSYLTTEPIAGVSTILNGPVAIEGGSLRVIVARKISGINGPFIHFLPGKGWWPFNNPRAVALAPTGSVYVADTSNHRIQKFDSNGNFITKWGSQGSEDGQFAFPKGIAVGPDGSVYVADSDNQRIQKFDSNGNFLTKWGSSGSGEGQFDSLMGIAVDSDGWVYAADMRNNRIQKFDSNGNFSAKWGSFGSGNGQFYYPIGIGVGSDSVYVVDLWNSRIQKFGRDGTFVTQWGSQGTGDGQFSSPSCVAAGSDGSVYLTDSSNNRIQSFNGDGTFKAKWGIQGSGNGQFNNPTGIAVRADGLVYVIDTYNSRIQKFDGMGSFLTKWGMQGSEEGEFIAPEGIAVGPDGLLYVADTSNHRIQKFGSRGDFISQWGSKGIGEGQFSAPSGIVAGPDGSVYVADGGNNRIQKFNSEGNFIAQWGIYGKENGKLDHPLGIALGTDGSVYVADTNNNRIQQYDQNGNFISGWGSLGNGNGQFNYPGGIAVGPDSWVYVADTWNDRVQVFDSDGHFIRQWGSSGSEDGQVSGPHGLTAGPDGSIYVADTGNHRIQRFDSKGNFIARWGGYDEGNGQFYYPSGVAVGEDGLVYAADSGNNRIQRMEDEEIDQVLFETTLPIDQPANAASD